MSSYSEMESMKEQYITFTDEVVGHMLLWTEGTIDRFTLYSLINGSCARVREANWEGVFSDSQDTPEVAE